MDDIRLDFLFTLYFITRMVKGHYKHENKDLMLSVAILHLLSEKEHTLSHLSKMLYSKVSSVSEKITAMENEGLVMKTNKIQDEREHFISLTKKGEKQLKQLVTSMTHHCVEFTKSISDDELKRMNPILKKILI